MPQIQRNMPNNRINRVKTPEGSGAADEPRRRKRLVEEPQRVDAGIVIVTVLMLCFGLVMLFSASMMESIAEEGVGTSYLQRQLIANVLGIAIIFALTRFSMKRVDIKGFAVFAYVLCTILLFMCYFFEPFNNARRWIRGVPFFGSFQPSELMKVVMVYCMAVYQSELNKKRAAGEGVYARRGGFKGSMQAAFFDIILPMLIALVPILLVLFQPHLSGALILLATVLICLLAAGLPFKSWLISGVIGLITGTGLFGIYTVLKPFLSLNLQDYFAHVITRLNIFSKSKEVSEAAIYQSRQSLIAIGSGGWTGLGLGQGKQKSNYLPEGHNDYIFSNIVEELGFVGGLFILLLFLLFFILGMRIAFKAKSLYAQIVAAGIVSLITIQALLNIAVNVQVIPPTGISLPFFSYGGTSNLFFLIGIGMLLNVSKFSVHRKEEFLSPEGGL